MKKYFVKVSAWLRSIVTATAKSEKKNVILSKAKNLAGGPDDGSFALLKMTEVGSEISRKLYIDANIVLGV